MRSDESWHDYVKGVSTFDELLTKRNLTSDFAAVQKGFPEFAGLARWAVEQTLLPFDEDKVEDNKRTLLPIGRTIKKANQRSVQLRLNLPHDDVIAAQEDEYLLKSLEKIIQVLTGCNSNYAFFEDSEVGAVTLRVASKHIRLWDEVIKALVEMADTERQHADFALKAVRIAREIGARLRK